MSLEHDEIQREYIDRVLGLREQRDEMLTPEDLQDVARDLGLTEADLAAAEQAARDHLARGEGYLAHGRYDDAVTELRAAAALAPAWAAAALSLAEAHGARWRGRGRPADRAEAEKWARRCLELEPQCDAAFEVLNRLDQHHDTAPEAVPVRRKVKILLVVAIAVAILLLCFLLVPTGTVVAPVPPQPPPLPPLPPLVP